MRYHFHQRGHIQYTCKKLMKRYFQNFKFSKLMAKPIMNVKDNEMLNGKGES